MYLIILDFSKVFSYIEYFLFFCKKFIIPIEACPKKIKSSSLLQNDRQIKTTLYIMIMDLNSSETIQTIKRFRPQKNKY